MRTFLLAALLITSSLSYAQKTIQIAAAADLQPLLPPVLEQYHQQTGVVAKVVYASSASLATQIMNGAPFDLFLSADLGFAQRVIDAGYGVTAQPVPYGRGTLVLWERNDGPVHPFTIQSLMQPKVTSVAIANPEHAPYGRAAVASLTALHLLPVLQPKLRTAENIAQAAQFVESGNAQFGLISLTSASTARLQSEGSYLEMPLDSYPPILQGAVAIHRTGSNVQDAQAFLKFLLSEPIQKELSSRGLKPPQ